MANKFPLILNTSANQIQELASGDNLDLTGSGIHNAGVITATSFSGNITGGVTGNADTATEATNVTVTANNSTDETVYPIFVDGATGTQGAESDTGLTYNPSSGNLTSTQFTGTLQTAAQPNITSLGTLSALNVSGNVSIGGTLTYEDVTNIDAVGLITARNGINVSGGNVTIAKDIDVDGHTNLDNVSVAGVVTATTFVGALTGTASKINLTPNNDNTSYRVPFTSGNTGSVDLYSDTNSGMTYNPSTGLLYIAGTMEAGTLQGALNATTGAFSGDATFNGGSAAVTISANSSIRLNNGSWTGDYTKITHHDNKLFVQGGTAGIRFRNVSGSRQLKMDNDGHFGPDNGQTYNLGSTSHRWANIYGVVGNFTGNIESTAAFKTSPSGTDADGVIIENSASLKLRVDSAKTVSFDARSNSGGACIIHKWNSPNAVGGNYEPYEEAWYDGNSYHKIKSNNDQFEFDSPIQAAGNIVASGSGNVVASGGNSSQFGYVQIGAGTHKNVIQAITDTNLNINASNGVWLQTNGGTRWGVAVADGNAILPTADNTYNIGSDAKRVKTVTANLFSTHQQGSPVTYFPSENTIIYYDSQTSIVLDNNGSYHTMKQWRVTKEGSVTIKFTARNQAGQYYWSYIVTTANGTRVNPNGTGNDSNNCRWNDHLDTGQSDSVHQFRTFKIDVGPVSPGDVISLKMANTNSSGTLVTGSQHLYVKDFRVYSATPTVDGSSSSNNLDQSNWVRNVAYFWADRSGNVSFDSSSFGASVPFNRIQESNGITTGGDSNHNFDTSTGEFYAPCKGIYLFNTAIYTNTSLEFNQAWYTKNGSRCSGTDYVAPNTSSNMQFIQWNSIIALNAGDRVGTHPYTGGTFTIVENNWHTYFKGTLLHGLGI